MVARIAEDHPLRRLFAGLVEQVFMTEMGICETQLTDYLTAMLSDFVHIDAIYRLRTVDGEVIREVSRVEAEAYLGPGINKATRRRLINRYIGDFTLFWTGVYPESLRRRVSVGDPLQQYVAQGKRSYGVAGELSPAHAEPPATLLRRLSREFERCVYGLHRVREGWERLGVTLRDR